MYTFDLIELHRSLSRSKTLVEQELYDTLSWKELYQAGLTLIAIRKYRDVEQVTLVQAKEAIEHYFKNR